MKLSYLLAAIMLILIVSIAQADFCFVHMCDGRPSGSYAGFQRDMNEVRDMICNPAPQFARPAFMIQTGDFDHTYQTDDIIKDKMGSSFVWYPVIGNHDLSASDVSYVKNTIFPTLPNIVRQGPSGTQRTTYSFDYQNAHFVALNEYWNGSNETGTDGDIVPALRNWLANDLAQTDKQHIFVMGHEPAYPEVRHVGDSLDKYPANRNAFWNVLKQYGVKSFHVGHTHYYKGKNYGGVWEVDAGACRGHQSSYDRVIVYVWVQDYSVRYRVIKAAKNDTSFHLHTEWTITDPTPTPTPMPTLWEKGDMEPDGDVDLSDLLRVVDILIWRPPEPSPHEQWAADMNDDDILDLFDALMIVDKLLAQG